jgi:hypothetical protein
MVRRANGAATRASVQATDASVTGKRANGADIGTSIQAAGAKVPVTGASVAGKGLRDRGHWHEYHWKNGKRDG